MKQLCKPFVILMLWALSMMAAASACASQLQESGMPQASVSLWSRHELGYVAELQDGADLASLPWGSYITPRLVLTNASDVPMAHSCQWRLDGKEIPFAPVNLQPGDSLSLCLSAATAAAMTPGQHQLSV